MDKNEGVKKTGKVKNFFKGLAEKLDKKMEEKAKKPSCCCGPRSSNDSPCCG